MSRPPVIPQQFASGIAVDPRTLERVIPESKRSDGSLRKQIRIRPGFTPQEDVSRFRGTRQQAMDAASLPKGHILGWIAPSSESQQKAKGAASSPPNKNAKRRANRKAGKAVEKADVVKDDWEDEDDAGASGTKSELSTEKKDQGPAEGTHTAENPNWTAATEPTQGEADIVDKLSKLKVK